MIPQFGLRVSVLLDANGANTTAAAAVRAAGRHLTCRGRPALVLGGTGPVGQRVAGCWPRRGARSASAPGNKPRRRPSCQDIAAKVPAAQLEPVGTAQHPTN